MRRFSTSKRAMFLAVAMIGSGLATASAGEPAGGSVLGRFDRVTGAFVPMTAVSSPEAAVARSGALRFVVSITYTAAAPAGKPLPACKVVVTHSGAGGYYYQEYASTKATRAGATGTCTPVVRYFWPHASTTDAVYYQVELITSTGDYAAGTLPYFHRTEIHAPASFALPANGATKTVNLARRY